MRIYTVLDTVIISLNFLDNPPQNYSYFTDEAIGSEIGPQAQPGFECQIYRPDLFPSSAYS